MGRSDQVCTIEMKKEEEIVCGGPVSLRLGGRRPWWVSLDPLSRMGTGPGWWHEPQAVVSQTLCSFVALMLTLMLAHGLACENECPGPGLLCPVASL